MPAVKFTDKPSFESVEILGKTIETAAYAGTEDRADFSRALITEAAGFKGDKIVVNGDNTGIRSVTPATISVAIELHKVNASDAAIRSAALTFTGWKAESASNPGSIEFFFKPSEGANARNRALLFSAVPALINQHPESLGFWKVVDAEGTRVFLREVANCDDYGRVVED